MLYDIRDAERQFEKLIDAAQRGEEVFLKDGARIVRMVPIEALNAKAAAGESAGLGDGSTPPPQ